MLSIMWGKNCEFWQSVVEKNCKFCQFLHQSLKYATFINLHEKRMKFLQFAAEEKSRPVSCEENCGFHQSIAEKKKKNLISSISPSELPFVTKSDYGDYLCLKTI